MKKLIVIALLMVGTTIIAQERNGKQNRSQMEQFTPEQRNQLQLKKMTLHLDLSEEQQKEMRSVITDLSNKREAHQIAKKSLREKGLKPTAAERFAMKNNFLDEKIALKKRMEKILNAKQFEKWETLQEGRMEKMKRKMTHNHINNREDKF